MYVKGRDARLVSEMGSVLFNSDVLWLTTPFLWPDLA